MGPNISYFSEDPKGNLDTGVLNLLLEKYPPNDRCEFTIFSSRNDRQFPGKCTDKDNDVTSVQT